MKNLAKKLFTYLGMELKDSCADDSSLFVEYQGKFYKLEPVEVSAEEYTKAWDSNTKEA